MKTRMLQLLVILIGASLTSAAMAKPGRGGKRHMKKMIENLDLSDEQAKQIKEIHKSSREASKAARKKSKESRKTFEEAVKLQKSDAELTTLHEEMIKAKAETMRSKFNMMLKMRSILNKDQKAKFAEFHSKHGKKRHRGKHGMDEDSDDE